MNQPRYRSLALIHPDFDVAQGLPGLRVGPGGRLATVLDAAAVRQAVLLLLSTRPGERINRPDYGCYLFRLAFAPNDDTTAGLAIHYVARAIDRWEKRIVVLSLDAAESPDDPALLEVRLHYRVRASSHEDNIAIVVPVETRGAR